MAHPLPTADAAARQKCYVTYTAPSLDLSSQSVTLLEAPSLLASSGTTGFRTWEAALHLASYLCSVDGKHYVTSKNVLELGAGTGFLSILCAAHLGANNVLVTDGSQEVINELKANLDFNGLRDEKKIQAYALQWGHALTGAAMDLHKEGHVYDLIIGADIVSLSQESSRGTESLSKQQTYDVQSIPALVTTIRDLFNLYPETKILISATVRNEDTLAAFLDACGKRM